MTLAAFLSRDIGISKDTEDDFLAEVEEKLDENGHLDLEGARDLIWMFSTWPPYVDSALLKVQEKLVPDRLCEKLLKVLGEINDYSYDSKRKVLVRSEISEEKKEVSNLDEKEEYLIRHIPDKNHREFISDVYQQTKEFIVKNGRYPSERTNNGKLRAISDSERRLAINMKTLRETISSPAERQLMQMLPGWS